MTNTPKEIIEYFDKIMETIGQKEYDKALKDYSVFELHLTIMLRQNGILLPKK